jgi:hypothetical protein
MRKAVRVVSVLGLMLANCATLPARDGPGWSYKANSGTGFADGPMALWAEPETLAFNGLRCNAPAGMLEFEDIEAQEFGGARPIRFEAGGQVWNGEERMKPPDLVPVSVARLPLAHPVVTAMGRGSSMRISGASGTMELPSSHAVRRVIRECRAAARR